MKILDKVTLKGYFFTIFVVFSSLGIWFSFSENIAVRRLATPVTSGFALLALFCSCEAENKGW